MHKRMLLSAGLLIGACQASDETATTRSESAAQKTQTAPSTPARPAIQSAETAPPNAPDQHPAFAGQTRAPLAKSNVALDAVTIASELDHPWAIEVLDDGRMLVTEKPGRLRVVMPDGRVLPPVQGVPAVDARGQGGLLDVAVKSSGGPSWTVCLSYAEPREGGRNATAVSCGEAVPDGRENLKLQNMRVIFRQQPSWNSTAHFGSRVLFTPDDKLFITLGERFTPESRGLAQRLDNTLGKIVRLDPNGMSAPDNPFYAPGPSTPRTQIWSYGHRNIQAAAIDPRTGKLWTVEHGPKGGDELNQPQAGKNYGWPIITYGIDYNGKPIGAGLTAKSGMEQPVYYWDPVIAPSGMTFYTGDIYPQWTNSLFIGGLQSHGLVRLVLDGDRVVGEERLAIGARIRDVTTGPDGFLYVVTDEANGRVIQLRPRR